MKAGFRAVLAAATMLGAAPILAGCAADGAAPPDPSRYAAAPVADAPAWMAPGLNPDERARAVLAQMTQDEKRTLVFGYFGTDFPPKGFIAPVEAREGSAGYVPGIARLGIPAQWQTDAGLGVATQGGAKHKRERTALPSGIATAATWNPTLARAGGAMIGAEARASGFNVMLAGGVNLMRDPRNGRNFEYGGEDPLLAGTMVGAQIAGIQSNHILSTVKHYAINDQETDRNTGNSVIDSVAARTSDLLAFQLAIEASNPGAVMCSYNRVNGAHACENPWLLTEVLRQDWGFPGFVMSDWGATHSTVASVKAGLDQDSGYPFDDKPYYGTLLAEALASGDVSSADLDAMALRILRSMFAHGLFDYPVTGETPIDFAAHAAVTRKDAEESIVLLRNQGGLLPLRPDVRKIVVIGGHADRGVIAGGGSSLVYPRGGNAVPGIAPTSWPGPIVYYPSSPVEAIRRLAPDAEVRFVDGSDPVAAAQAARESDVAIVFATQWAGESFDVSLTLADGQDALIGAVAAANPRTAVVLETGGPVLMPWAGKVGAVLEAWYPGTEGGAAIADVLFGRVNPSGHLPATFPASIDQLAHPGALAKGDVTYTEGATVGYKWYDARGLEPLYPFGHGLSYTSFGYEALAAEVVDGRVTARFRVRNTGDVAGKDVAQLYVAGSGWEAPKRLGGFAKVTLAPGAAEQVVLTIDPRLFATFDGATKEWYIAGGRYELLLGASSRDIRQRVTVMLPDQRLPVGWKPKRR